jgi:hypothetical protein
MGKAELYPLRFDPIYQYRLWGGRRLAGLLSASLPGVGPIGEAWVLSDRTNHQSLVANGPVKGRTLGQVMEQFREQPRSPSGRRQSRARWLASRAQAGSCTMALPTRSARETFGSCRRRQKSARFNPVEK